MVPAIRGAARWRRRASPATERGHGCLSRGAAAMIGAEGGAVDASGVRLFPCLANRMSVPTSSEPNQKWRLALLLVAVALTVVVPVILLRTASIDSMQAMEQVNHSQQVEAQSYALIYDLRNVEAAALAIAAGVDARELPDRIEQSRERIAPALDTLQALTRDNPDQQVRIGVLRTNVELRMDEVDRMIAGTSNARSEEHTSELQSLMRISYAVFCLKKNKKHTKQTNY